MDEFMKGVTVLAIQQANPNDTRGETWQWFHNPAVQTTVCRRKAGSFGCHVHHGDDPSKKPECIFIADGEVEIVFHNEQTGEKKKLVAVPGMAIFIDPFVAHQMMFTKDTVIFESRVTKFNPDKPDTYPAKI